MGDPTKEPQYRFLGFNKLQYFGPEKAHKPLSQCKFPAIYWQYTFIIPTGTNVSLKCNLNALVPQKYPHVHFDLL